MALAGYTGATNICPMTHTTSEHKNIAYDNKSVHVFFSFPFSYGVRGGELGPLSADSPSQLDVLGHDRHTLSMDGTQVGVFEKSHEIRFRCFLLVQKKFTP